MVIKHDIKKIEIEGVEWEYIIEGSSKRTLLILPGGGQTAQSNFQLIGEFQNNFKVIAITILNSNSLNVCCSAINEILKKEGVENNVIVYGLSLGGLIAQSYTLRNKEQVKALILSHACTPNSKTYKNKVIRPLYLLKIVLPLIPDRFIRSITNKFAQKVQGINKDIQKPLFTEETYEALRFFAKEFRKKYLTKRLLKTWLNLHLDFYKNERINETSFKDWKGKVLILRTDNDPLMQDEGNFIRVYPHAKTVTFNNTGHLSFYYKFNEIVKEIRKFLLECKLLVDK